MSETARKEVEADIEDHEEEVGSTNVLQHKANSNKTEEEEKVVSDCDQPKVLDLKDTVNSTKPRSTMKPLTIKQSNLSDLDEFISIINQKISVTENTSNELEQLKDIIDKPTEKPSKFKNGKHQLTSLLQKQQTDAFPTQPAESFIFEGAPVDSVLRRNETDFSDNYKDGNIEKQVDDEVKEYQNVESLLRFLDNTEELSSFYVPFNEFRSKITYNEGLLEIALGEKFVEYKTIVKNWMNGNIDRKSYAQQISDILPKSAIEHHNELVLNLLKKSFQLESEADRTSICGIYKLIDSNEPFPNEPSTSYLSKATRKATSKSKIASELTSKFNKSKRKYDDDDDDFMVIKKSKKRKQIVSDDEEEPQRKLTNVINRPSLHETEENDFYNLNKSKRKRKMVILSDDEDDDELNSILDTRSSASNVFNDPKTTINVKSTGLLKTTLTIKRNDDVNDAKNSVVPKPVSKPVKTSTIAKGPCRKSTKEATKLVSKKRISKIRAKLNFDKSQRRKYSSSLLDRLLSSDKRISLLPSSSESSENHLNKASNQKSTKSANRQTNLSNKNNKPSQVKSSVKSNDLTKSTAKSPSKNSTKWLNSSNDVVLLNNSSPNSDTNQAILNTVIPKRLGGKSNSLLSREPAPTFTTSAQKSSVVTSKIIELLNRKSVASSGGNSSAQSSSSSSHPARKPSALETLLTAPINGFIKEALIPDDDDHFRPLINGTASENHHRPKTTHNRKEASRKAKRVSETYAETVPCSFSNSTYQVNGSSENSKSAKSMQETALVAQARLNQKNTANYCGDVNYQLEEYDDDDECVLPLTIKGSLVNEVEDGENVIIIKKLPSYERASLVTSCFDEVCLPNNEQLSLRIMDTAARFDLKFAHQNVVPFFNARLRDFMKNIITKYATTRSAFSTHANQIPHHIGLPVANPYLNTHRILSRYPIKTSFLESLNNADVSDSTLYRNFECQVKHPEHLDSELRPKKYGTEKNRLSFSERDQASFSGFDLPSTDETASCTATTVSTRYRPNSGCLRVFDADRQPISAEGSLRHLFNVLKTEKALVPNHNVYLRAIFRTISAISNSESDGKGALQK